MLGATIGDGPVDAGAAEAVAVELGAAGEPLWVGWEPWAARLAGGPVEAQPASASTTIVAGASRQAAEVLDRVMSLTLITPASLRDPPT